MYHKWYLKSYLENIGSTRRKEVQSYKICNSDSSESQECFPFYEVKQYEFLNFYTSIGFEGAGYENYGDIECIALQNKKCEILDEVVIKVFSEPVDDIHEAACLSIVALLEAVLFDKSSTAEMINLAISNLAASMGRSCELSKAIKSCDFRRNSYA